MNPFRSTNGELLPREIEDRICEICDQFESAWKSGLPPDLEIFLETDARTFDARYARELLAELVIIDLEYRWRQAEQRAEHDAKLSATSFGLTSEKPASSFALPHYPLLEHYVHCFTDLGPLNELPAHVIRQEYRVRRLFHDKATRDEYVRRFPSFTELPSILDEVDDAVNSGAANSSTRPTAHDSTFASRRTSIRCAHCHHRIDISDRSSAGVIHCKVCGGDFQLVADGATTARTRRVAHFELIEQLGRGSFGTVWRARDTRLHRDIAVKIPRAGQLDPSEIEQFLREGRTAAQLKHPNIVRVYDAGYDENTPFIVSDIVRGAPLSDWLSSQRLTIRESVELCVTIADALQHAHEAGVIHRDLKPANIIMDEACQPHLTDFGLAKRAASEVTMTVDGQLVGTPAYMSPEQARGESRSSDARSDIYSLGVILYELLTGERPFRGSTLMLIPQVIYDAPPNPRKLNKRVPRDLETICLKCLEKEPSQRYRTARELGNELKRFLNGEPIQSRPIGKLVRSCRWCKRKPVIAGLAATVVLLVSAAAVVGPIVAIQQASLITTLNKSVHSERAATRRANALRLATQSRELLERYPQRALLLSVEAMSLSQRHGERPLPAAHQALRDALRHVGGYPLDTDDASITSVRIAADGRRLAAGSSDGRIFIWDLILPRSRPEPEILRGDQEDSSGVNLSPNGRWLVSTTGAANRQIGGPRDRPPRGPPREVRGSTSYLWDLHGKDSASRESTLLLRHEGKPNGITFSPDGRWFVIVQSGTARLWDLTAEQPTVRSIDLVGHDGVIIAFTVSRDGRWLVTAGEDKTARVWNVKAADPAAAVIVLDGHPSPIRQVAITGDNHWVITRCDNSRMIYLWDLTADDPSATATHLAVDHSVTWIDVSPDNRWLLASFRPPPPWLGSPSDGQNRGPWREPGGPVRGPGRGFGPGLGSGGSGPGFRGPDRGPGPRPGPGIRAREPEEQLSSPWLWDLTADDPAANPLVLKGHSREITSTLFSKDGRWLVTASKDSTVRCWELGTNPVGSDVVVLRSDGPAWNLAMSSDGRWLMTAGDTEIPRLWDLWAVDVTAQSNELRGHSGPCRQGFFAPGNDWLVTVSADSIRVWDLAAFPRRANDVIVRQARPGGPQTTRPHVDRLGVSPDGRWLVGKTGAGTIRLWDVDTPTAKEIPVQGLGGPATTFAISPNSRWLAVVRQDGALHLGDLSRTTPGAIILANQMHTNSVRWLQISRDSHWLICGNVDGTLTRSDLSTVQRSESLVTFGGHDGSITRLVLARDGHQLVAAHQNGAIRLWDISASNPATSEIVLAGSGLFVRNLAISPDGHWLIATADESKPKLWNLKSDAKRPYLIDIRWQPGPGRPVAFSPDSRWLLVGDSKHDRNQMQRIRLWDLTNERVSTPAMVCDGHNPISFSRDSHWLAASNQKGVHLWRLTADDVRGSVEVLRSHTTDRSSVSRLSFSADGQWLLGTRRASVHLWDLLSEDRSTGSVELQGHDSHILDMAISPGGRWLFTSSGNQAVDRWNLCLEDILDTAKLIAGREFTAEERRRYSLPW